MKKFRILFAFALLLCLAACDTTPGPAPETQAKTTAPSTHSQIAPPTFPETEPPVQIYADIFKEAIIIYSRFSTTALHSDKDDVIEIDGMEYRRVTDLQFTSLAALQAALREHFSADLTRDIMAKTNEGHPLYIEHERHLYTCMGPRSGGLAASTVFDAVSESETRVVYRVHAVFWDGGEDDFFYTRELVGGRWLFTEFEMDWW